MVKKPYFGPGINRKALMMEPLTARQQQVLEFIAGRLGENAPPSQQEIADHFGLAQNAAYQLVGYLKKKGYLVSVGGHRGLRLSPEYEWKRSRTEGLPILGRVAAGTPILAEQNIQGYLAVEKLFGRGKEMFLLKIAGDSMVDEGIMDGDYVVIQAGAAVENGQIGVVLLDDEATVKRVFIRKDRIALKPANRRAGYKTRYIKRFDKDVRILGKVVGCIRTSIA
jgi:repressor LexA